MPVTDERARFKSWAATLHLDQHNYGSRHRNGRGRMHDDAQLAMVGIALERMRVRHLDHRQQRQEGKAHHGGNRQSAWLRVAYTAGNCPETCQ